MRRDDLVATLALRDRLPTLFSDAGPVTAAGGLVPYTYDLKDTFQTAAMRQRLDLSEGMLRARAQLGRPSKGGGGVLRGLTSRQVAGSAIVFSSPDQVSAVL
jgi:hypothetical protein